MIPKKQPKALCGMLLVCQTHQSLYSLEYVQRVPTKNRDKNDSKDLAAMSEASTGQET
jgi:hypothetical protein